MAHVFKPSFTKPIPKGAKIIERKGERFARFSRKGRIIEAALTANGTKVRIDSDIWHVRYKVNGQWKRETGYTDKDATVALGVRLEKQAARRQEGLADPHQEANRKPLAEHVQEFRSHLEAAGNCAEHVHKVVACVRLIIEQCGFATVPDISASKVEAWLAGARKRSPNNLDDAPVVGIARSYREIGAAFGVSVKAVETWRANGAPIQRNAENNLAAIAAWRKSRQLDRSGGLSVQSTNHYTRAIKQFTRWLVSDKRAAEDPLANLKTLNVKTDRRHDRRALRIEEFGRLLEAAVTGPVVEGIPGPDRAMLYLLAGWTGFRRKELGSLTRRSFDLESNPPKVTVLAAYAKNKRTDSVPLHPVVVNRLQEWFATKPEFGADEPLFDLRTSGGGWRRTGKMMRVDLKAAGLPYQDEAGLYADFHSNRHTFVSNLARAGVPLVTAQKVARHSTPSLTANVYTHLELAEKATAINALPAPIFARATNGDGAAESVDIRLTYGPHDNAPPCTATHGSPRDAFPGPIAHPVSFGGLSTTMHGGQGYSIDSTDHNR